MRPFTPEAPTAPKRGAFPPKKAEECKLHPGQLPPPFCATHATEDVRAWHDPDEPPPPLDAADPHAAAEAIRVRLRGGVG